MIENIRKYTGLMIVVLVLLFVGLVFFDSTSAGFLAGDTAMEVDGKPIAPKELQRSGARAQRIAPIFGFASPAGQKLNWANSLLGADGGEDANQAGRYLANRLLVAKAGRQFGVRPSLEEIETFVQQELFVTDEGQFDQPTYESFLNQQLGQLGMNSRDFNEILLDLLTTHNLYELFTQGLSADLDTTRSLYDHTQQNVHVQSVTLQRQALLEKVHPDEAAIRTYWEAHQQDYQTIPQRRTTYVLAAPDWAEVAREHAEDKGGEANPEALSEAVREQAIRALAEKVDTFWQTLINTHQGADFEKLAQESGFQVVQTELFPIDQAPEFLLQPVTGLRRGTLLDQLMTIEPDGNLEERISDVYRTAEGWVTFRLDEAIKAQPLPFEEARDQARQDYIAQQASELLLAEATKTRQSLQEKMEKGASFDATATALQLEVTDHPELSPPPSGPNGYIQPPSPLYLATRDLAPGSLSEPLPVPALEPQRIVLAHLVSRTIQTGPLYDQQIDFAQQQNTRLLRIALFQNWLNQLAETSGVRLPQAP